MSRASWAVVVYLLGFCLMFGGLGAMDTELQARQRAAGCSEVSEMGTGTAVQLSVLWPVTLSVAAGFVVTTWVVREPGAGRSVCPDSKEEGR